jgi:hypothetical protein
MTPTTDVMPEASIPFPPPAPNPLDEPTVEECLAEWRRYYDYPQGLIDPGLKHSDEFVAFYDGKVVDYDPSQTELRARTAARLGVHPARLVISHLGDYTRFG